MAWVQIQKAQEMGWAAYEQVAGAVGVDENPPDGLIIHAAGEENGKWLLGRRLGVGGRLRAVPGRAAHAGGAAGAGRTRRPTRGRRRRSRSKPSTS